MNKKESELSSFLFEKPLKKFIILIVLQIITFFITSYFPNDAYVRGITISLNILIIVYLVSVIIHVIRKTLSSLMSPKNVWHLIGAYALLLLVLLLIISTLYNFAEITRTGYLTYGECTSGFSPLMISNDPNISRDFFYFSTMTFFTVGYGDICPMGTAKLVSIIGSFIGHVVSVVLIALILNNYMQARKKE